MAETKPTAVPPVPPVPTPTPKGKCPTCGRDLINTK